jgi:hypothetical protein
VVIESNFLKKEKYDEKRKTNVGVDQNYVQRKRVDERQV